MDDLAPSDLKAILHSKRANLYYLEYCRVMQKDGRVLYLTEATKENLYFNIPIANTTVLLLGNGTSITQAAMRMLAQAGVLVGFCGGGGTPLYMGNEIEWFTPQNEYRPTEYLQGWMGFWFDDDKRLAAAKTFQHARIDFLKHVWQKDRDLKTEGFDFDDNAIQNALNSFFTRTEKAINSQELLLTEAQLTKVLYKYAADATQNEGFKRQHQSTRKVDIGKANDFLNHGNYLAYGLAACTLWVLGIPHGFAVMHGKTRRGALVFDIADLIKDALVLPWAFICAKENATEQEFRQQILQAFTDHKALDYMFEQVKKVALQNLTEEQIDAIGNNPAGDQL
ncbi:type I-F CRISPR-associated endonuclease Cas1f [Pseudoalteromonas ruthenica]|uniref:CRISPR-associated endonuclease Cas1 n=1 Tax=Pseudoalteromonas ruthenica TaxID=151081 RepID=A0A0F4Q0J7_9GAMM|nr:type I-F CRISPR-associated endonuclease Cas1f [Pseudoalteromonas ruthenica]KJZ00769.1 CRISPR-associated protein Cas1 [Pseudoalteromonas ruthenica]KJZ01178.1 CRISPR-associated protein Cas1 [Pseudoalteromonas ruthenica]TMO85657.1 type I-F CRISPR-associated endonuclease Cas1 [Pseudoalteromonas ruthenica]TMO92426.1 type I-F CRISPR-associated endonuclease Cas1 [Pseudoalteromonas ruthenica]TMO98896.1 type I-F CRISPR-associated endonuclease Cas1 [Pseudoalteromonas ruthenica]